MSEIRIWAPRVREMQLELVDSGERVAMSRSADGVFTTPTRSERYMLRADGNSIVDPWAHSVDSVLGPCRRIAHEAFAWTDRGFVAPMLATGIVYELHIGTFTEGGTFDSACERLPDLVELGITHVEIMPVATFSGDRGWGYDGAALFAPHPAYGGPAGLQRFVDRAHALGLAVLLDVVYNHLGPIGNYLEQLGPFFRADRQTPWGAAVNLDGAHCEEVRRYFIDNALHWLRDYHFDGLRLDAIHALEDQSAIPFLEQLGEEVRALGIATSRTRVLIAESDLNDPRVIRSVEAYGYGMDAQWSDDFHHALHVLLTHETTGYYADFAHEPLHALARSLQKGWVYAGQRSHHRSRPHGRPLGDLPLSKILGYAQNHDQVGNRARGERLSQLVSTDELKLAMTLVLTAPFVPMLFAGEEWGASTPFQFFTDHRDEAVAEATGRPRCRRVVGDRNAAQRHRRIARIGQCHRFDLARGRIVYGVKDHQRRTDRKRRRHQPAVFEDFD